MNYVIGILDGKVESYEVPAAPDELAPIERCATYAHARQLVGIHQQNLEQGRLIRHEPSEDKLYTWYEEVK